MKQTMQRSFCRRTSLLSVLAVVALLCSSVAQAFSVGDRVQASGSWTIRSSAAGTAIGTTTSGYQGTIIDGPTYVSLSGVWYYWYKINWESGTDGWSVQDGLTALQCDIVVQGTPTVSPNPVTAGSSISVGYIIHNNGPGNAGTSQTKIQIKNSSGAQITAPTFSTPAINADASSPTQSSSVPIPVGTAAGTYTAYVVLDNLSELDESNTGNDLTAGVNFTVTSEGSGSGAVCLTVNTSSGSTLAASEINAALLFKYPNEVDRITSPGSNPMNFTSISHDDYYFLVFCWDMLAAESGTFTHNLSTTPVTAQANPKRPLTVTVFYNNGSTVFPGATVYLDSCNGETGGWTQRASATADGRGTVFLNAWPTTQTGEKYRIRIKNGSTEVGGVNPVSLENTSSGSSYSVTTSVAPPAQTGDLGVRLKKVDGTDAPVESGTPHFLLMTTPAQNKYENNPATFSGVPAGTYLLEAYHTGTFFGEEFWNSQWCAIIAYATTATNITRTYPYARSVVMKDVETGATITAGQTIAAGTQVRFEVTVQNDVPSTALDTQVHFLVDLSQDGSYDYDSTSATQTILGSGGTKLYTFTKTFDGFQTGQFYFALEVMTSTGIRTVRTDSWGWTQACRTSSVSRIDGLATKGSEVSPVFLTRYPAGTTAKIDPNLCTWIISHGRTGHSTDPWVTRIAAAIAVAYPDQQILLLDWATGAYASGDLDFSGEGWIQPVATWAAGKLADYGFIGSQLNLIGHSWGSYVVNETAERMPSHAVNSIVALDPAYDAPAYWGINLPGEINFSNNSSFAWAFWSGSFEPDIFPATRCGNHDTAATADESFIVVGTTHSKIVDLFAYMLENNTLPICSQFKLSRLLAGTRGSWRQDQYRALDTPFPTDLLYEGTIYSQSGVVPNLLTYVRDSDGQTVWEGTAPALIITSPANSSTVTSPNLTVTGTACDSGLGDNGISSVTVNGINATGGTASGANAANWSATITLNSGENTITVVAADMSNNSIQKQIIVFYDPGDTTPPALSITSPAHNSVVTGASLSVSGTASDSGRGNSGISSVSVNGINASGGTASGANPASWNTSLTLSPGANTITVVAKDGLNNPTTNSITVTYNPPETQGPALTIISPVNNATVTSANLAVNGTATDSGRGGNGVSSVTVNGINAAGGTANGSETANWSTALTLSLGTNTIAVVAKDGLNNSTTNSISVTYNPPETQGPDLTIISPPDNSIVTNSSLTVAGTASDNDHGDSGVSSVTVNGIKATGGVADGANTANWNAALTLNLGTNTITVVAGDGLDNLTTNHISVTYRPADQVAPIIQITQPTTDGFYIITNAFVTLSGTASDADGLASLGCTDSDGKQVTVTGSTSWITDPIALTNGINKITMYASDPIGNVGRAYLSVIFLLPEMFQVVFQDDFNNNTIAAGNWTNTGNVVQETEQMMKVRTTVTDAGGRLVSQPFSINRTGLVTITRSVHLYNPRNYFVGYFKVTPGTLGAFGVHYAQMAWDSPENNASSCFGFYLGRNGQGPHTGENRAIDTTGPITGIWNAWFNEKLTYDPVTGQLDYFINNIKRMTFTVGALPTDGPATLSLDVSAWGWGTGYEQFFDDILITQAIEDGPIETRDTDHDGMPDWAEMLAGTSATNPASCLVVHNVPPSPIGPGGFVLEWASVTGVYYNVNRSTNLLATPVFVPIKTGILGLPGTTTYTDTNSPLAGKCFYRIGVDY